VIDLREYYGAVFHVAGDDTAGQSIPCKSGRIVAATRRHLALVTDKAAVAKKAGRLGFARVIPADKGYVVLFPSCRFLDVAAIVEPEKSRQKKSA